VKVLTRTGRRYRETDREMFVDSKVLTGPSGMTLYKSTKPEWDPPYENVPVTDSDRDRILTNIRRAFRSKSFEIDVI
jgi:immunity protein 74 of polymorphic toxin system